MLTEICDYLHNRFDKDEFHRFYPRLEGEFAISEGTLPELAELLIPGQCFYIYGSRLNDGVYQYTEDLVLNDETFRGLLQSMRVEPDFLALVAEIEAWQAKYGTVDSVAMSPFNSESFSSYSYSKSSGGSSNGSSSGSSASDPVSVFRARLNRWKKI